MTPHHMLSIGQRPLHPVEALVVAVLTAKGMFARQCGCGMLIAAADEIDVRRRYLEHYRLAKAVAE